MVSAGDDDLAVRLERDCPRGFAMEAARPPGDPARAKARVKRPVRLEAGKVEIGSDHEDLPVRLKRDRHHVEVIRERGRQDSFERAVGPIMREREGEMRIGRVPGGASGDDRLVGPDGDGIDPAFVPDRRGHAPEARIE